MLGWTLNKEYLKVNDTNNKKIWRIYNSDRINRFFKIINWEEPEIGEGSDISFIKEIDVYKFLTNTKEKEF